jgi:hypothetical protein
MDSLLKRAAPYLEAACFVAAWIVGIAMAVGGRGEPTPPLDAHEVVASEQATLPADPLRHRSFRPVASEELGEGG